MAVYADGLKVSHNVDSLHFVPFEVVGSLYQSYPGVRAVIDSVEPATPRNLVQRFRGATPTYAFIEKNGPSDEGIV